jgi:hypothetical protein
VRLLLGVIVLGFVATVAHLLWVKPSSTAAPGSRRLLALGGLALLGLGLLLYRRVVVVLRARGTVEVRHWCGVIWARTVRGLPGFDRVELHRKREVRRAGSEYQERFFFPVVLAGDRGGLRILTTREYLRSRSQAEAVARFTGRDLVDLTEGVAVRRSAEEVSLSLAERLRRSGWAPSDRPAPAARRVAVDREDGCLRLRLRRDRRIAAALGLGLGALVLSGLLLYAGHALSLEPEPHRSRQVTALAFLALGGVILAAGVRASARRLAAHEIVEVTRAHLTWRLDASVGGGAARIALEALEEIEPGRDAIVAVSDDDLLYLGEDLAAEERAWVIDQLRQAVIDQQRTRG